MSAGPQWQHPHTFEALCALGEAMIRAFFSYRLPKFSIVERPALVIPQGVIFSSAYRFAIVFDAVAGNKDNSGATVTVTWSHTTTGSNTFMVINDAFVTGNSSTFLTATYNLVSATQAVAVTPNNGIDTVGSSVYYLINPVTGANNVVLTYTGVATGARQFNGTSITYTGAKQSAQPDSFGSFSNTSTNANPIPVSTTVIASNCWIIGNATCNTGDIAAGVAGSGTTYRGVSQFNMQAADGNGTVGTGSQTLNFGTLATNGIYAGTIISIAPADTDVGTVIYTPQLLTTKVG